MFTPQHFEITVHRTFTATHALKLPDGTWEPMHGHDWPVWVTVASKGLDAMQTVMDFHELERLLEAVIGPWRGGRLNDVEPFNTGEMRDNPSAERVAWVIATRLARELRGEAWLQSVTVGEAPGCTATLRLVPPHDLNT